jgi:phage terminase large subunit
MQKRQRILCARELQVSIKDSVHRLLADQIEAMGVGDFYEIQRDTIKGKNGTEFLFKGLRHNIGEIKSTAGITICWVEEAQTVSKASWETLIPTIREDGSQIIVSFNPELEEDETYKRFVKNPPANCVSRKVNWDENPFFPDVLRQEKDDLKVRDEDAYLTVWEGHTRQVLDGAIYARELRQTTSDGRICKVPYDRSKPVHTFWDLGRADNTSIWFGQVVGFEFRFLDYYQANGYALDHYLKVLSDSKYQIGTCWLPHDAQAKLLGSKRSIEEQMRDAGRAVKIVPRLSVADGINAARTLFPNAYFDEEMCADGLQCLRHYRYDVDPDGHRHSYPLHDWASHGADAFRYAAIALKEDAKPKGMKPKPRVLANRNQVAWMGR